MGDRIPRERDLKEKQAATPEQKPKDDWRKKAIYNINQNSEAPQEKTSSSSDRDLELDVDIAPSPSRRQQLRKRRWQENRSVSGGAAASSESQIHRYRRQDSEAGSRHNDAHSSTRQLGELKGGTENQASVHYDPDWRPSLEGLNNGTEWYVGSRPPGETEDQ